VFSHLTRNASKYELFGDNLELSKFSELENRIRNVVQEQIRLKRRNEELEGLLKQKELELNEANISVGELRE